MLVRRMQWLICCLLLSISLGLPSQAQGKELNPTAYLQNVEGEVMVQKGGGLREFRAFEGMPIQQGDRVRTSVNSSVQILLTDTREVVLGQTSQIFISELTEAHTTVKLLAGEIWNKTGDASKEERDYTVETSSIIVNVQGTLFHVHVDRSSEATSVRVFDGEIEVEERGFTGEIHFVQAFEQFISKPGSLSTLSDPLDLHSLMQETHASIVMYVLQDLLAVAQWREQQSIIHERLYQENKRVDDLLLAAEEVEFAALLLHLGEQILREIAQSTMYADLLQKLRQQDLNIVQMNQLIQEMMRSIEKNQRTIWELAENANVRLPNSDRWIHDVDEEDDYEDIEEPEESEDPGEPEESEDPGEPEESEDPGESEESEDPEESEESEDPEESEESEDPEESEESEDPEESEDQHVVWLEKNEQGTSLLLRFHGIPSNQAIVALQVHLELESEQSNDLSALINDIPVASTFFAGQEGNLVQHRDGIHFSDRGMELILVQMLFGDGLMTGYDVQEDEMITIETSHSRFRGMEPWQVRMIDVFLVDVDGNLIEPDFDQEWVSIEGGHPRG